MNWCRIGEERRAKLET